MNRLTLALILTAATGATALAQPTVDGSVVGDEAFYGPALSTQNTRTQFGDNTNPNPIVTQSGGSEINQVFARVDGGRLHVLITGVLETNFNKLEIFFDSVAGGVNSLDGANLPIGVDGFCCGTTNPNNPPAGQGALQRMDGLTFDAGFNADRYLTITNGFEQVNENDPDDARRGFWAVSAHFADLTQGASGAVVAAGVQFAGQGRPNVLRNPMDYNRDRTVNAADYTLWRDSLNQAGAGLPADGNGDGLVNAIDYDNWAGNYGADAGYGGPEFLPSADFSSRPQVDAGLTLPGLGQGQLVDRAYALGAGGCVDDTGAGCVASELEFVLNVAPDEAANGSNHRLFQNTIDLMLAIDNSEVGGVRGSGSTQTNPTDEFATVPGEDNPEGALTGIEFSLPLSALGAPSGDIRLLAFVNGGGHDFLSNQFSGAGNLGNPDFFIGRGNLGQLLFADGPDPALITLADIPGDQFVTIGQPGAIGVPEPTGVLLAALALCGLARRRGPVA